MLYSIYFCSAEGTIDPKPQIRQIWKITLPNSIQNYQDTPNYFPRLQESFLQFLRGHLE